MADKNDVQDNETDIRIDPKEDAQVTDADDKTIADDGSDEAKDEDGSFIAKSIVKDGADPKITGKNGKGRLPSFDSLRKEHDTMIVTRLVLTVVVALILMIPIPITFIGVKFVLFVLLAYASIYNEVDLRKESELRKDGFSRRAHIASYVTFTIVLALFLLLAIIAGLKMAAMTNATDYALWILNQNGLGSVIVK